MELDLLSAPAGIFSHTIMFWWFICVSEQDLRPQRVSWFEGDPAVAGQCNPLCSMTTWRSAVCNTAYATTPDRLTA